MLQEAIKLQVPDAYLEEGVIEGAMDADVAARLEVSTVSEGRQRGGVACTQ